MLHLISSFILYMWWYVCVCLCVTYVYLHAFFSVSTFFFCFYLVTSIKHVTFKYIVYYQLNIRCCKIYVGGVLLLLLSVSWSVCVCWVCACTFKCGCSIKSIHFSIFYWECVKCEFKIIFGCTVCVRYVCSVWLKIQYFHKDFVTFCLNWSLIKIFFLQWSYQIRNFVRRFSRFNQQKLASIENKLLDIEQSQ